jgi:hypothetical protein
VGTFAAESGQLDRFQAGPANQETSMKKQALIVASFCFVVGLAIASAKAQDVEAKVPFSFTVSGKILPAGDYTMIIHSNLLKITNGDGRIVALASVYDASGGPAGEKSQIIFHCYGDRCFLAELWSAHQLNGRELMTSQAEAKAEKQESRKYFAVLGEEPLRRQ